MKSARQEQVVFLLGKELEFQCCSGIEAECVMSPRQSNLLMDGIIREWKARIMNADACLKKRDV